jgi:hypothetical protein
VVSIKKQRDVSPYDNQMDPSMHINRRTLLTSMLAVGAAAGGLGFPEAQAGTYSLTDAVALGLPQEGHSPLPMFRVFTGPKSSVDGWVQHETMKEVYRGRKVVLVGDEAFSERVRRQVGRYEGADPLSPVLHGGSRKYHPIGLPGLAAAMHYPGERRRSVVSELRLYPDSIHIQDIDDPDVRRGLATYAHTGFLVGYDVILGIPDVDLQTAMEKLVRDTRPCHWNDDVGQIRVFHQGEEATEAFLRFARGAA